MRHSRVLDKCIGNHIGVFVVTRCLCELSMYMIAVSGYAKRFDRMFPGSQEMIEVVALLKSELLILGELLLEITGNEGLLWKGYRGTARRP